VAWIALVACAVAQADAGVAPDPSQELQLIESTERGEDPLGIDPSTGEELERAAARLPPEPVKLPAATQGAGLSSIDGVREREHVLRVRLEDGLARTSARITLASQAKHASEVAYRYPLATGAVVARVRVCVRRRCADAVPQDTSPRQAARARAPEGVPGVEAQPIVDGRGPALALRVGPVLPGSEVSLELDSVAPAPLHGGTVRLTLPPRGYDPNLAETLVEIEAPGLHTLAPGAPLRLDPWTPLVLHAALPSAPAHVAHTERAPCGATACTRSYEAAAATTPSARPTWLLLDASPSMEGPARGRAGAAIGALLAALADDTPLRVVAFAAAARIVGTYRAGDAPLATLVDGLAERHGAATYLAAPLALLEGELARERPRIVVVSDGRFDPGPRQREALERAHRRGASLWLVHVGDREARFADVFASTGGVLPIGAEADEAETRGALDPLVDRLRASAMPATRGGPVAGEERVRERAPAHMRYAAGMPWLAHWLLRARPSPTWRLDRAPTSPASIAALPYASTPPAPPPAPTSLPRETVLSMLRTQLVPRARACLRSDRRGRGDYAVALTFHGLFAAREVEDARVSGTIPDALRGCLEALLPALEVPAFTGRVRVAYPIHTEREAPAPVIELLPDAARTLEGALGAPPELR